MTLSSRCAEASAAFDGLPPRQWEVALLTAKGCSAKVIARELGLSPRTVEHERAIVFKKLGIHCAAQLAIIACLAGLVVDWNPARLGAGPGRDDPPAGQ